MELVRSFTLHGLLHPPPLPNYISLLAIHRKWNLMYYADDAKDIIGVAHVEDSHWTKNELKQNVSTKKTPSIDFTMPLKTGNMYTVKVGVSIILEKCFS